MIGTPVFAMRSQRGLPVSLVEAGDDELVLGLIEHRADVAVEADLELRIGRAADRARGADHDRPTRPGSNGQGPPPARATSPASSPARSTAPAAPCASSTPRAAMPRKPGQSTPARGPLGVCADAATELHEQRTDARAHQARHGTQNTHFRTFRESVDVRDHCHGYQFASRTSIFSGVSAFTNSCNPRVVGAGRVPPAGTGRTQT